MLRFDFLVTTEVRASNQAPEYWIFSRVSVQLRVLVILDLDIATHLF